MVKREIIGGTGPKAMEKQLISAKEKVQKNVKWMEGVQENLENAEKLRVRAVDKVIERG